MGVIMRPARSLPSADTPPRETRKLPNKFAAHFLTPSTFYAVFHTWLVQPALFKPFTHWASTPPHPSSLGAIPAGTAGPRRAGLRAHRLGQNAGLCPALAAKPGQARLANSAPRRWCWCPRANWPPRWATASAALAQHLPQPPKVTVVFGGVSINPQMMGLRGGTEVLVATPGRLLDLVAHNASSCRG